MSCSIVDRSTFIPKNLVSIEDLKNQGLIPADQLPELSERGFQSIPIAFNQSAVDMLFATLDPLLESGTYRKRIKFIIMPYSHYAFPHSFDIYSSIRERYGLTKAEGFSVKDLYCTSFLMGLQIMEKYLQSAGDKEDVGLLLSIEKAVHQKLVYWDGYPFVTGDAGTAAIMSLKRTGDTILATKIMIDNRTDQLMDFSVMIHVHKLLKQTLDQAQVALKDIKLIIPNNTNIKTWLQFSRLLKIPEDLIFSEGLRRYGHINNCDLLLNLSLACELGRLQKGDHFILLSTAIGGGLGCAICRKG